MTTSNYTSKIRVKYQQKIIQLEVVIKNILSVPTLLIWTLKFFTELDNFQSRSVHFICVQQQNQIILML